MATLEEMMTGGNLPATPTTTTTTPTAQVPNYGAISPYGSATPSPFAGRDYNQMVQSSLESFLNPNSQYIQNARRRGMEFAAQRGGINSSIAAGAAERSAIEAASPMVQSAVSAQMQQENAQLQNWVDEQGFRRDLASMPYKSSVNMLNAISQMAAQDPELYTPTVVSGFANFFNQNMNDIIGRYFGGD